MPRQPLRSNAVTSSAARKPPRKASAPVRLGDLVTATFDQALAMTRDPARAAELAALAVQRALRRAGQVKLLRQLATT